MLTRAMVQQKLLKNLTRCVKFLEEKSGDAMEIVEEKYMLREHLKALQQSFNGERWKAERGPKTIQVSHKDLK